MGHDPDWGISLCGDMTQIRSEIWFRVPPAKRQSGHVPQLLFHSCPQHLSLK